MRRHLVFFDLELLVTRYSEGNRVNDVHAREKLGQVRRDQLFQRYEGDRFVAIGLTVGGASDSHQPRHVRRNLYPGEALRWPGAAFRSFEAVEHPIADTHHDTEIE